jgi:(R,R)-butanediol dehydrogenase/meso-butanediol dehydrogenase/diacetyl reductase
MRALMYYGRRDIRLEEIPTPQAGAGEVRIRVTDAGLSQTQVNEFIEGPFLINSTPHPVTGIGAPMIPCQEFGGVVDQVGEGVEPELMGQLVAALPMAPCMKCHFCDRGHHSICPSMTYMGLLGAHGGFSEYVVLKRSNVYPMGKLPRATLCFIEPLLMGVHTAKRAHIEHGQPVLMVGAGAVGCGMAAIWRDCYGADVYMHDILPARLERAEAIGLPRAPASMLKNREFSVVVDAAGKDVQAEQHAFAQAQEWISPGGSIVDIGLYFFPLNVTPASLLVQEISVIPSWSYALDDVPQMDQLLPALKTDFTPLIEYVSLDNALEHGYYRAELDKSTFTRLVVGEA